MPLSHRIGAEAAARAKVGATLDAALGGVGEAGASDGGWVIEPGAGAGGESGSSGAGAAALGEGAGAV